MVPKQKENVVGRNGEIALGTTLIAARELLGCRDPFQGPPRVHFELIWGVRGSSFAPLPAAPTS